MPDPQFTQVFTTAEFKREARALKKRYRQIESDLQPLIEQLRNGDLLGDRIPGFADYIVYKVRVKNSDIRKGKSGGYRASTKASPQIPLSYSASTPNLTKMT